MDHLTDISVDQLQQALETVEDSKATQRLTAAIAYKNGVTQTELAEWYNVQRRTIYSWLTRLESDRLDEAVEDLPRSGRPRKLDPDQQERLETVLRSPPTEAGYEAASWTPALLQQYLADRFGVEYSRPSCRRLMKDAGLRYEQPPANPADCDRDESVSEGRSGRWIPK